MECFIEERFPEDISFGAEGGPSFQTEIVQTRGGHEHRNQCWEHARARYTISHGVKTKTQLGELIAFFRTCGGRALGFRFKDWMDFEARDQLIGVGDGQEVSFQLIKDYEIGGEHSVRRMITKPVPHSVDIIVDGARLHPRDFEVDTSSGMVTLREAPSMGAPIRADFEFDVPVRFDTDYLSASMDQFAAFGWRHIELVELR